MEQATSLCNQTCATLQQWVAALQPSQVHELCSALAQSFWLDLMDDGLAAQLCEVSTSALASIASKAQQLAQSEVVEGFDAALQPLISEMRSALLAKLTDVEWALTIGLDIYTRFRQCCVQVLELLTTCLVTGMAAQADQTNIDSPGASQWLHALLELAAAALHVTTLPDAPPELRAFFVVNSAWKQVVRLAPHSGRLRGSLPLAFSTSWEQYLVRIFHTSTEVARTFGVLHDAAASDTDVNPAVWTWWHNKLYAQDTR